MWRPRLVVWMAAALALAGATAWAAEAPDADAKEVVVTVTGISAHSYEEATQDALRNAVKQGAGETLTSLTRVERGVLLNDIIISRAAGYVRRYDPLGKTEDNGVYRVEVRATVARGKVADDLAAVQMLIRQVGWPNLVIHVEVAPGGPPVSSDAAEAKLMDFFEKLGFDIVDPKMFRQLLGPRPKPAEDMDPFLATVRLHASYGIMAKATIQTGQAKDVYGIKLTPVTVTLDVKAMGFDNAAILARKSATVPRNAENVAVTAQALLEEAAAEVAPQILMRLLEHWAEDIDIGRRVVLLGRRIDTNTLTDFLGRLKGLDGVKTAQVVNSESEDITIVKVVSRLDAASLAQEIGTLSGGRLKLTGYAARRVDFAMNTAPKPAEGNKPAAAPAPAGTSQ
jgi:hypothetical protein